MNDEVIHSGSDGQGDATRLCVSCGICCTGLLHRIALLKPEEVPIARRLGLELDDTAKPSFKLPCHRFDGCCTVYEDRPRSCQRFRCALLRKLDAGEVNLENGLQTVAEAHRLTRQAQSELTTEEFICRFQAVACNSEAAHETPVRLLGFTALARFLDKHFVLKRDGYFLSENLVEPRELE